MAVIKVGAWRGIEILLGGFKSVIELLPSTDWTLGEERHPVSPWPEHLLILICATNLTDSVKMKRCGAVSTLLETVFDLIFKNDNNNVVLTDHEKGAGKLIIVGEHGSVSSVSPASGIICCELAPGNKIEDAGHRLKIGDRAVSVTWMRDVIFLLIHTQLL